jgi:hypothetical protein
MSPAGGSGCFGMSVGRNSFSNSANIGSGGACPELMG